MIRIKIITPEGLYKESETSIINVTSVDGERGILPNHMPTVFMMDIGKLEIEENGNREQFAIDGGMFYFENNEASLFVNAIEAKHEIDVDRAVSSKERQLKRLSSKDENIDMKRAEIALKKALNRIKIAG